MLYLETATVQIATSRNIQESQQHFLESGLVSAFFTIINGLVSCILSK
jgi:hypothetical protein